MKWFKDVLKTLKAIQLSNTSILSELSVMNDRLEYIEAHIILIKVDASVISDKVAPLCKKDSSMEKVLKEIKAIRKYTREAR